MAGTMKMVLPGVLAVAATALMALADDAPLQPGDRPVFEAPVVVDGAALPREPVQAG